jgi:hypothetical protein
VDRIHLRACFVGDRWREAMTSLLKCSI